MICDLRIIDAHKQISKYSCIPSGVEIVLKLLGKVNTEYYDLQKAWRRKYGDNSSGSFIDFNGCTIKGLTFKCKFHNYPRNAGFPFEKLFHTIDDELATDRYVLVSLKVFPPNYHIYLICDKNNDDYIAYSKGSNNKTIEYTGRVKAKIQEMQGTDILIYSM